MKIIEQLWHRVCHVLRIRSDDATNCKPCHTSHEELSPNWPLDEPFVQLTEFDALSVRDMFEGVFVLGNTGSGKTSTTGTMLLSAALHAGWGIAIFCTKPDDRAFIERLVAQAGRMKHLRVISPTTSARFNLMRYELNRPGGGNSVRLAMTLMEAFSEGKPMSMATENSEFFRESGTIVLTFVIDALRLAGEDVSFRSIERFLGSAPKHVSDLQDLNWREGYCFDVMKRADELALSPEDRDLCENCTRYFLDIFVNMNERTRGDINATIDAALFQLGRPPIRQLLDAAEGSNFIPEMLDRGAIMLIDCPPAVWGPAGRMLTIAHKRLIKDSIRRRLVTGDSTRPLLLYLDECQVFVTRDDAEFLNISRSNRVSTVMMTQSIDNIESMLGSSAHSNSLTNALTTHVYHATSGNSAQWIESKIAQAWRESTSYSYQGTREGEPAMSPSMSVSEQLKPQVLASELTRLKTGGPLNNGLVDAIVFKPGRIFAASNAPFARVQFQQA